MIADMHCHVDLYAEYAAVVRDAAEKNVWVLAVTTTPKAFPGTSVRLKGFPNVAVALGFHPELAAERAAEIDLFEQLLTDTQYVGEVGLDGSPAFKKHAAIQENIFTRILRACSARGGRILTIHSRRAATEVLDCISKHPGAGVPIMHWFSGNKAELVRAMELGCWFSVGSPMLTTANGSERVKAMPRDRVLLETDGPFGTIEQRPLRPSDIFVTVQQLAALWRVDALEATKQLEANQKQIFVELTKFRLP